MRKFLIFLAIAAMLSACRQFDQLEDLTVADHEAEFAIPLVIAQISIKDILENFEDNTSLIIDNDGLIHFIYKGDIISRTSQDIFDDIDEALPPIIPVLSNKMALPFSQPNGLQIDRLDLKGGTLVYAFSNEHLESVEVSITLPQVTKEGQMLSFQHSIPAYSGTGSPPFVTNAFSPASLDGYRIIPENDTVYIEYEAIRESGISDTLSTFFIQINDLDFYYAEGFLGNEIHEGGRDTIDIDFFDTWIKGDVYFEEPKITFNFENSFGIPTRSIVNIFDVFTVRGEVLPLESDFVNNGIDFPYPSLDEVGQIKTDKFIFTKENSNIDVVLGSGPVAVDYDVDAITNPDFNTDIRGFITDSSYYKVRVEVELPLYGRAFDFVARDSFDINFSEFEDVAQAEFKLITENSLPLDVAVQAYFHDENGRLIDSLLDSRQKIIEAAPVDAAGVASSEVQKVTFANFTAGRFEKIQVAKRLILHASFSTYNAGSTSVKIFAHQQIKVRIGAKLTSQ